MFLQSVNTAAMEKALSALWERNQLIQTNIANEDTPGYKAKRLSFETALQTELEQLDRSKRRTTRREAVERIDGLRPVVYSQLDTITRADGNNVDILAEQIELSRLQFQYQALTQKVSGYYSTLRNAITGGR